MIRLLLIVVVVTVSSFVLSGCCTVIVHDHKSGSTKKFFVLDNEVKSVEIETSSDEANPKVCIQATEYNGTVNKVEISGRPSEVITATRTTPDGKTETAQVKMRPPATQPAKNDTLYSDALERTLFDPNSGKSAYIGFRTGQLLVKRKDLNQSEAWLRENSIDAGVVIAESRQWLLVYDMVIFPIESSRWETMNLAEFRKILPAKGFILEAATMQAIESPFPQTYVFRNRTGDVGLLQVLSVDMAGPVRSVQIRYKLVRPKFLDQAQSTTKPKPKIITISDRRSGEDNLNPSPPATQPAKSKPIVANMPERSGVETPKHRK